MELAEAGRVEDALSLFRASVVLLEEVGDLGSLASAYGEMGRVKLAAEDHAAAEHNWARARELALQANQREYAGKVTAALGTSRLLRGDDSDEVLAMMMEAVDLERDAPDRERARTFYTLYLLHLSRRAPAEAAAALVELAACRRREGAWVTAREAYAEAARLYAEAGDAARAAHLLAEREHIAPP
jgi:tetratricopeptide (TPR) repeat protein